MKVIRLTESDIHQIVLNTAKRILQERHVLEIPKQNMPMDGGMPPMDAPMDNSMPPMNDAPMGDDNMGGGMPPMDNAPMDGAPMGDDNMGDMPDFWGKLNDKQKDSVKKYAESMIDSDDTTENSSPNNMGGEDPNNLPMQESFIREFNMALQDREEKREYKKIPKTISRHNPFVSNRK